MAESEKKDSGLKEKNLLLDFEIGKDFLNSWKSMSTAEGDAMDFDLMPVSKGNKKLFNFDKADMDFNLDGDFGKISSFNIDMSDLDISPPLNNVGKYKDNLDGSSSGMGEVKNDRFTFAFDFDELENFSLDSSLPKEGSKPQKAKINKESSPEGTNCEDKESSMRMDLVGSINTLGDVPQKSSLQEAELNIDMDCLVGRSKAFEDSNIPSNLAVDDAVTSVNLAARYEVLSDKRNCPPQTTIASRKLLKISQSEKLVSAEPTDLDASAENDAKQDFSSAYHSNCEPSNSSRVQEKVDCTDSNTTGSLIGNDVQMPSVVGLTCNNEHMMPENLEPPQPAAIAEKNSCEKSEVLVKNGIEPGQVNPLVEKQCARGEVLGILDNMPSASENQETASVNLKLPFDSQLNDLLDKESRGRKPLVTSMRSFTQSEITYCPVTKAAAQKTCLLSSSSKRMALAQPSTVEGREADDIQGARKLVSLPLPHSYSKTLLMKGSPQTQNQENCKGLKRELGSDGLQDGKQPPDSSTAKNEDIVKPKPDSRPREMSSKDLDTLSSTVEISNEAEENSGNPTALASISTTKCTPGEEQKFSSIVSGKKPPELCVQKLSGLKLDSAKFPIPKDVKSGASINRNQTLVKPTPSNISHFPDSQKRVPRCLSAKRKTLEKDATDTVRPSKRLNLSLAATCDSVKTSEAVHDKEVPNHYDGDNSIKCAPEYCQASTFQIHRNDKSFTTETDSNIKLFGAYGKELDDLCNMLRKKHDEAKELLVRSIVNSNKLLMLNSHAFEEKIRATQKLLARLTLTSIHG